MKLLAPCSDPREVPMLVASGAQEIYCGFVPAEWVQRYGHGIELNRRNPAAANLPRLADLAQLVDQAHRLGVPVFATFNGHAFHDGQLAAVLELCRLAAEEVRVDALIVSDLALMEELAAAREDGAAWARRVELHVSSLAVCHNAAAVRMFQALGARRVILPRHLDLDEIAAIRRACPQVELEVFILNDGCAYEEGHCHTVHGVGADEAFCMRPWQDRSWRRVDGQWRLREDGGWSRHLELHRQWLYQLSGCGCSTTEQGLPYGPCGLCALPELARCGIDSLKVVGRQASAARKLRSVQLVAAVLRRMQQGAGDAEVARFSKGLRGNPEGCRSGSMCYYRDPAWQEPRSARNDHVA